MDLMTLLAPKPPADEGQRRMMAAAEALFDSQAVKAQLHEHDEACQKDLKRV